MLPIVTAEIVLRPANDDDLDALFEVQAAQDTSWWGSPDGDVSDVQAELDRVRRATGSLEAGSRVVESRYGQTASIAGFAALVGHGQSNLAIDTSVPDADVARRLLVEWLVDSGATGIDAPAHDGDLLGLLADAGYRPTRSSFELERQADVTDLGATVWPSGIAPAPFGPGDDEEVHGLIYSVWTDVDGHTDRPIDEWRSLFVDDASFVADLALVARRNGGHGPVAGVAMCRTFAGGIGWVNQLAVGYPDRGVGLGRALLVESFQRLSALGVEVLGLGVEAANVSALGLYRSVGLEVTREWVHCSPS